MYFKEEKYSEAQKYFSRILDLPQINNARKTEAAFWAGRAADFNNDRRTAEKYWRVAAAYPMAFYGALSSTMLGHMPEYEFFEQEATDADIAEMQAYVAEKRTGGHACFSETAMVLGTYPELVRLDRTEVEGGGLSTHRTDHITQAGFYYPPFWFANYPNAFSGHSPAKVTKGIADLAVKLCVEKFAAALKVIKDDTVSLELNAERKKRFEEQ